MNSGFPGIVVIDDSAEELDRIKAAFFESGVPCLPVRYVNDDPSNESGIDHIELSDWVAPRIVVTDLNLTESQGAKAVNLAGPLAKMLGRLAVKGPYLLCMWSKLEKEVDGVIQVLEERYREEITLPLQVAVISKTRFLEDAASLRGKIRDLISESTLFDILLNWELRVSEAGRRAVDLLYSMAQDSNRSGSIKDRADEMRTILAAIANEAVGPKNAKEAPALAMECGLIPVLEDQIRSMSSSGLDKRWISAVPEIGQHQEIGEVVKSKLNAFYHVEDVPKDYAKNCRGVFVALDTSYLADGDNLAKFEGRIGRSLKALVHEEFLPKTDDPEEKALRAKARNELTLGFLEVSPACDYAQRKVRFPRYILGALIPEEFESLTFRSADHGSTDRAHDGIHRLPKMEVKGSPCIVKLSYKYQFGTQPDDNKWFGPCLFRVRDQVLTSITFGCSQYASRPGVINFT